MMATTDTPHRPFGLSEVMPWLLRLGVGLCFIGHGAFGLITKAAWVDYFAVVGISADWAWRLMPWVGALDVAIGFLVYLWPCRALMAWGALWCVWTALLRPLAGQGWPEFFERAGNYGVPLAILAAIGWKGAWLARLPERWHELDTEAARRRLEWVLRLTTVTLLAGHAGCALLLQKPALEQHYVVLSGTHAFAMMHIFGWIDLAWAVAVLVVPRAAVGFGACAWKLVTECLFLTAAGVVAPGFEVIERGGSYVAPLALGLLFVWNRRHATSRATEPLLSKPALPHHA